MTPGAWFVLFLVVVAVALFVWDRYSPDVVALGVLVSLVFTGILDIETALSGFANSALITVAALFVLTEGVIRTGAAAYLTQIITVITGDRAKLTFPVVLIIVAVSSAFLNNTPVVVLFVPILLGLAERHGFSPSKVLLPLSYAAVCGGMCTLIGTSTNLLINTFADTPAVPQFEPLGMFEFLPLGLVFVVIGLIYLLVFGPRMLPDRRTVTTLAPEGLFTEYVTEILIHPKSDWRGSTLQETLYSRHRKLQVVQLIRSEESSWNPDPAMVLERGDILMVKGPPASIAAIHRSGRAGVVGEHPYSDPRVRQSETTLAEVILSPGSRLLGRTLRSVGFRRRFGASVIAIQRHGLHVRRGIAQMPLKVGDLLLVQGEPERIQELRGERDVLLLEGAGTLVVENRRRAISALAILGSVVFLASIGVFSIVSLALAGAVLMIVTRCLSPFRAYRAVNWEVLVLIAGMIALGHAMERTGLTDIMAGSLISASATLSLGVRPWFVLAVLYLFINLTTNVLSNNAAAVLWVPIALEIAAALDVSSRPFLICVAFSASVALSLPVGYQTHLIVYGPGGYKVRDFLKFGTPLSLLFWFTASALIPVFWPF